VDPFANAEAVPWLAVYRNRGLFRLLSFTLSAKGILTMTMPAQPNITLKNTADYRENYSNSIQIRVSVWDFFLVFGTLQQQTPTAVEISNFQGIYLSPQQAKALLTILQQNVVNYEKTFGEIKLDPRLAQTGIVN